VGLPCIGFVRGEGLAHDQTPWGHFSLLVEEMMTPKGRKKGMP